MNYLIVLEDSTIVGKDSLDETDYLMWEGGLCEIVDIRISKIYCGDNTWENIMKVKTFKNGV